MNMHGQHGQRDPHREELQEHHRADRRELAPQRYASIRHGPNLALSSQTIQSVVPKSDLSKTEVPIRNIDLIARDTERTLRS
jgi:hypothetical protein